MAYILPIHPPSSTRHAIKLNFLSADETSLVVAKANRLEIYEQTPEGLSLAYNKVVYGRISMIQKLRPSTSATDHLFVGTDRYMYFTLSWDAERKQIKTEHKYVDQAEKSARDAKSGDRCNIDPTGSFMTLEMFEGIISVIPLPKQRLSGQDRDAGAGMEPTQLRIDEMFVRSSTFIETRSPIEKADAIFALLHEDASRNVRLKFRKLQYHKGFKGDPDQIELTPIDGQADEPLEQGATHLVPISGPAYGVLILGETSIEYYEPSRQQRKRKPLVESTLFVAWEQIDQQRFVLADEFGKLYLLMLDVGANGAVTDWKLDLLGETSRASVLVYLENGRVFVGSHQGDSQIILIKPRAVEVLQTLINVAPILDFTIMDMGNRSDESKQANEYSSGQARIVAGSGAFKDGSLRSVRSGVGLEDLGQLGELENIKSLFSLRLQAPSQYDDTLLVSFVDESRVFHFSADGDVEELEEAGGLVLAESTIFASNTSRGHILQVTPSVARLFDPEGGMLVSEWRPDSGLSITQATANASTLMLAFGGSQLVSLDIIKDLSVRASRSFGNEGQVACINVSPSSDNFGFVGLWQSNAISVVDLTNLKTVHSETDAVEEHSVPRALLLAQLLQGEKPTLFIAVADGNVVTYTFDPSNDRFLTGRTSTILGTQEASFQAIPREDGIQGVFAISEHASLIYGSEGNITFSAVTASSATHVCPFNAQAYPMSVAIASATDLRVALVDEERKTHVQGLRVGQTVRRIAYSSELKAFGLGTIERTLEEGVEIVTSNFKLADEITFGVQATFELNENELIESVMRAQLPDGSGGKAERFVIGTAYLDESYPDISRGRIIVFEITEDRHIKVVMEQAVKGACRGLAMIGDKIVAALVKTVVVYALEWETNSRPFFTKSASYRVSTAPIDLYVDQASSTIVVADLMKAISIVKYTPGQGGQNDELQERARYYQTTWSTAVAQVNDPEDAEDETPTYLLSDAEGNLVVLQQNTTAIAAEDRRRLQVVCEMSLGEMVNRIRTVAIPPKSSDAPVSPRAFMATTDGSIYLYGSIKKRFLSFLLALQEDLATKVFSPGGVPFESFRAFKNTIREGNAPYRFVDGELIEQFLYLDQATQQSICGPLEADVNDTKALIEGLRRLR